MMSDSSSCCSKGSYAARNSYNSTRNVLNILSKPFDDGGTTEDLMLDDALSCKSESDTPQYNMYSLKDQESLQ